MTSIVEKPHIKRIHSITRQTNSKFARVFNKINVYDYFLHERPFTNVKILLQHQTIWCDKASLASASPIFHELFLKNTKDEPLVFHDIELHDFLTMLEFIYPVFNPEINEINISSLLELSYRFQFDILKHACQIYIIKYLSTIRRVFDKCQNFEAEGDCEKKCDLVEFDNRICIDAFTITTKLCRWLKIYSNDKNILPIQAIISILRQMSIDSLEQAISIVDVNDQIKAAIYKERAQYLEQIFHIKHIS